MTFAAGWLVGLAPAAETLRQNLMISLRGAEALLGQSARWKTRDLLVAAQTAVTLALLVGAGHFVRTEYRLLAQGREPDLARVIVAPLRLPAMLNDGAKAALLARIDEEMHLMPGVESVCYARSLPFGNGEEPTHSFRQIDGGTESSWRAPVTAMSSTCLGTLGLSILRGRMFADEEVAVRPRPS